ncbi:amidohydrolase [Amycolatopsis jejuensis]|uniref:amidohydrolase n=1 Tax=Amycolatopsis jejuensis TaxID=330084 RepID=UPI00068D00B4|nr:amidohydrolase [Amycolatopsis jejuensis]
MTDLVLLDGRVYPPDGPPAEALAVSGGRISAVGSTVDIAALAGPATRVIRLGGRAVIPGLVDSHCHFENAGMDGYTVSFDGVTTIETALERIAALAATRSADGWVLSRLWNPVLQTGRAPDRLELDRAAGGRPVYLPEGHAASVSTAALRLAGIDPAGHDGRLVEGDVHQVARFVPEWTVEERAGQMLAAMQVLAGYGITSVVAGALPLADVEVLRSLAESGRAPVRVAAMVMPTGELNPSVSSAQWRELLSAGPPKPVGDFLSVRGIKLQIDGGMTLGTAATREGYHTDPEYHGEMFVDRERLTALVAAAHEYGWPVGTHVVGDAAIDLALDVYEATRLAGLLPDVLIHASMIQPDQIVRARELGVQVATQLPFLWRNRDAIAGHLGAARADGAIPLRDLVDGLGFAGVCAGTDYPVNALDPWQNIHAMTTRHDVSGRVLGAGQAITRAEAVDLYTVAGAAHTGEAARKGRLEPGFLADVTVLDTDPFTAADLRATQAVLTVTGGRVVHDPGVLD